MGLALSDFFIVDVGAVETAEVAYPDIWGVDVEEAVIAGDGTMDFVIRELGMAVLGASYDAGGAGVEGKFLTLEVVGSDSKDDLCWHLNSILSRSKSSQQLLTGQLQAQPSKLLWR